MKYIVARIVEAHSAAEAIRKAKRMGPTEVYIHAQSWEKDNYSLTDEENKNHPVGFGSEKKGTAAKSS